MYICIRQDGGAVGFVEFTKLSVKPAKDICKKKQPEKRMGPITRWPPQRLLFTRLEIIFVSIVCVCLHLYDVCECVRACVWVCLCMHVRAHLMCVSSI